MKFDNPKMPENLQQAACSFDVVRVVSGQETEEMTDCVVSEEAITVMIDRVGSFTIMATPSDIEALAVGFVYSEGIINSIEDVLDISTKPYSPHVVGIQIHDPTKITVRRNMIVASSCGMCGTRNIERLFQDISPCGNSLEMSTAQLINIAEKLQFRQQLFQTTGGSHAAGIFNSKSEIIAFAEDIGRHTAFDKAIGKWIMARRSPKGHGVALSGRVSLEMATKAARAGIELVAAVSAPSSFAIKAANQWNITICGFVRPGRMNIYTHPERIK